MVSPRRSALRVLFVRPSFVLFPLLCVSVSSYFGSFVLFCVFNISFSLLLAFVWFLVLICVFLEFFPLFVVVLCIFVRWGKGQCCRSG